MWACSSNASAKHYKNSLGAALFTNKMLFLALGRKEVQKAVALHFTLVHLPRLPQGALQLTQASGVGLQQESQFT